MLQLKPRGNFKIGREVFEYVLKVADEGGYVVSVPELQGCISEGDNLEEAWEMIRDAVER